MMINIIISIVLAIFGLVLLLSAVIMAYNVRRARTPRAKKLLLRRSISTGVLTLVAFGAAAAVFLTGYLPVSRQRALAGDAGYELAETYKRQLDKSGEGAAYLYLPTSIYGIDGTAALRNERGEWFVYEQVENSEGKKEQRLVNRGKNTLRYETVTLSGEQTMTIQLGMDGRLYVDGTFPYMIYDHEKREYSGKLADGVKDFVCNGNTLFYLTETNELYALGLNDLGQMGDSSNKNKVEPTFIKKDIVQVAGAHTHTLMVDIFGNLYAVGDNADSQLGDGTMTDTNAPIKIMGGIKQVAAGNYFSVILAQNGDVYTCGRTTLGQCGNNTKNGTAKPEKIAEGALKIVAAENSAAYMTEKGEVFVWGENKEKCFALDDTPFFNAPTHLADNAYDIALLRDSLLVLDRDRNVQVTGSLRTKKDELFNTLLKMDTVIPKENLLPYEKEEKPDISELGKE